MARKTLPADPAQLGFDDLLADAETINKAVAFERTHGHLPDTMETALPYYRELIIRHHAAMLAGDAQAVRTLRENAANLALRLNGGAPGILAGPEAPGCKLAAMTAAPEGDVPLWGQDGRFIIETHGIRVLIAMHGMFGIGARFMPWPNFAAHAVDRSQPFISETGFRSFMGLHAPLVPDLTPDGFAIEAIASHIRQNLKGKLRAVEARYSGEQRVGTTLYPSKKAPE